MMNGWASGKSESTEKVGAVKRTSGGSVSDRKPNRAEKMPKVREVHADTKSRLVVERGVAKVLHG